jgi:glycerol-3-phosphate responsive antiterminator
MNTLINRLDFGDKIYVYLQSDDVLSIPYSYTKKIQNANKEQLLNYRLIGGGIGVHFEEIDEDISLGGIISYKIKHELKAS